MTLWHNQPFYRWNNWGSESLNNFNNLQLDNKNKLGWWLCPINIVSLTITVLALCLPQSTWYALCSPNFVQTGPSVRVIMTLLTCHLLSKSNANPTLQHQHLPKAQGMSSTVKVISPSTLSTVWNLDTPKAEHRARIQTPGAIYLSDKNKAHTWRPTF